MRHSCATDASQQNQGRASLVFVGGMNPKSNKGAQARSPRSGDNNSNQKPSPAGKPMPKRPCWLRAAQAGATSWAEERLQGAPKHAALQRASARAGEKAPKPNQTRFRLLCKKTAPARSTATTARGYSAVTAQPMARPAATGALLVGWLPKANNVAAQTAAPEKPWAKSIPPKANQGVA